MIGLGVAWLTSLLGLSLALGAFLAGLIISESEYSHQALGNLLPLLTHCKLPLSYLTDGQNVPDDIEAASAATLARRILRWRDEAT